MKNERLFFDLISPIYGLADTYFASSFKDASAVLAKEFSLAGKSVLDIGVGSGSWALELHKQGAQVTGIDFSQKMLKKAKDRCPREITILQADALALPFPDQSFDIVTSSLVLHGPGKEKREKILKEMMRVSRGTLIINDYYKKSPALVHMAEAFEASDYYYFRDHFEDELKVFFKKVNVFPGSKGLGLYLAQKY